MFSHITVGTNNAPAAIAFYDAVLSPLGRTRFTGSGEDGYAGYGTAESGQFWVLPPFDDAPATSGNGTMIAFLAPDRETVRMVHKAAMDQGGVDEGPPGLRPHYHPHYYGAYFRDLDGNKLLAVCHTPEEG